MTLEEELLAEKLRAPRALQRLGPLLYGAPLRAGTRAWCSRWQPVRGQDLRAALRAALERASSEDASGLAYGGPPGNYLVSGADLGDTDLLDALVGEGFRPLAEHRDLRVRVSAAPLPEGVRRCAVPEGSAALHWIAETFAAAWSLEAERALAHDALFLVSEGSTLRGFAAHSGNNVAAGTFGPIGVHPDARGKGYGASLALAAFRDLAARGFSTVTVPWVEPRTVAFYEALVSVEASSALAVYVNDRRGSV